MKITFDDFIKFCKEVRAGKVTNKVEITSYIDFAGRQLYNLECFKRNHETFGIESAIKTSTNYHHMRGDSPGNIDDFIVETMRSCDGNVEKLVEIYRKLNWGKEKDLSPCLQKLLKKGHKKLEKPRKQTKLPSAVPSLQ